MNATEKAVLVTAAVLMLGGPGQEARAAAYGCFKVRADSINIRARPYSTAEIIDSASKGEILEKRKLFCTPRGFWCAVRKGSLEGYADKGFMEKVACP